MIEKDVQTKRPDSSCTFVNETAAPSILDTIWKDCECPPEPCAHLCQSVASRNSPSTFVKQTTHACSVIAYIRLGGDQLSEEEQVRVIKSYCALHDYEVANVFTDTGKPSYGLQNALQELSNHDALIAVNLNAFVENDEDRIRDLRPFIHHFFCRPSKHLITIQEGLDTGTAAGQLMAVDITSQVNENQ